MDPSTEKESQQQRHVSSSSTSSSSNLPTSRKRGIDSLLQQQAKSLPNAGAAIVIRLVKGPSWHASPDPVDAKAPPQDFPLIAKFPASVVRPDFEELPWKQGRWYQQNTPKPMDDSDEEIDADKKRWTSRRRRNDPPQRQWILQEQVDFLETMVARREKRSTSNGNNNSRISSRYEGVPEHAPSHYTVWQLQQQQTTDNDNNNDPCILVSPVPTPNGHIVFSQPSSRKTYSLTEAEHAIEDARAGNLVRNMHNHGKKDAGAASKSRLLNKLQRQENATLEKVTGTNDDDDVMADVAFRNRKGSGGTARKELLDTLGDGVAVAADGTLGGTNDAQFGGANRFNTYASTIDSRKPAPEAGSNEERGADGAAMADDFYQRDVQAEYEELDYDANELFDDDDVDLGEGEVQIDNSQASDDAEDEDLDELDNTEEAVAGAEGLASVAGFKAMLAKARGEVPAVPVDAPDGAAAANTALAASSLDRVDDNMDYDQANGGEQDENDHMAKIMAAADKAAQNAKDKTGDKKGTAAASAIQVDENGLRLINLEAVRREIWLNHGQIPIKRLMKIFDVKKKSAADRQSAFRDVVKELCTIKADPVGGKMLVLKQHYSNMG